MGGVYNSTNLQVFNYGNNNPVKYTDPDGRLWKGWKEFFDEVKFSAKIAFNFDFGYDAMQYASEALDTGNYLDATIWGVNSVLEAGLDLTLCYLGAKGISQLVDKVATAASASSTSVASEVIYTTNKLNHVFGNPQHNLDKFLSKYSGNTNKALNEILKACTDVLQKTGGLVEGKIYDSVANPITVKIGDDVIRVGGIIKNGSLQIGAAYIE